MLRCGKPTGGSQDPPASRAAIVTCRTLVIASVNLSCRQEDCQKARPGESGNSIGVKGDEGEAPHRLLQLTQVSMPVALRSAAEVVAHAMASCLLSISVASER